MKKLFALVLSFCLCLTMCPKVFADENENIIKNGNFINGTEPWYINKKDNTNGVVEVTIQRQVASGADSADSQR